MGWIFDIDGAYVCIQRSLLKFVKGAKRHFRVSAYILLESCEYWEVRMELKKEEKGTDQNKHHLDKKELLECLNRLSPLKFVGREVKREFPGSLNDKNRRRAGTCVWDGEIIAFHPCDSYFLT